MITKPPVERGKEEDGDTTYADAIFYRLVVHRKEKGKKGSLHSSKNRTRKS